MRDAAIFVALLPVLIALDLAVWISAPERRILRSAVAAGIVAGRCWRGAAW